MIWLIMAMGHLGMDLFVDAIKSKLIGIKPVSVDVSNAGSAFIGHHQNVQNRSLPKVGNSEKCDLQLSTMST